MKRKQIVTLPFAFAAFAAMATSPSLGSTTIRTKPNNHIFLSNFTSIGQTFTVPKDHILEDFSVDFYPEQAPLTLWLYAWDGSNITGSRLYISHPHTGSIVGDNDTFSFTDIDRTLVTGKTYVALFKDTTKTYHAHVSANRHHYPYNGGELVAGFGQHQMFAKGKDFSDSYFDLAFTAKFCPNPYSKSPVPEPGAPITLGVFACGLAGLAFRARKAKCSTAYNTPKST